LVVWNGSDFVTAVSPSSNGTVTTVSVASANGFTGSVSNPTSTPAITLTTSISGVLKGNGTAISAATSGTDYSAGTSALATGILKSTTSTGALTIAVAGDFPTLNQSTTGTAAGLSAILAIASGGTNSSATPTAGGAGYGTGTAHAYTAAGTAGQVLTSQGASAPTWTTLTSSGGTVTSVSGTGTVSGLTLSGTVTSSGSLTLGGSITGFVATGGALGTPSSGTLSSCTADGTNAVGYKNIPQTGSDKTTAYTLVTGDVGKYVGVGTGGSIVVPTSTFANGDAISIFNNTTGSITITTTAPTAYIAGANTVKTSITLATRGIATILFVSATVCVVSGNVS
jgi:hypothetical protein